MRTTLASLLLALAGTGTALGQPVDQALGQSSQGPLRVVSRTVDVDKAAEVVRFEVVYDRAPDFQTVDAEGRPADSFQFHLDTATGNQGILGISPYPWEAIVRGDEIHLKGDLPVRDHTKSPSSDPASGGWGPVVGSVAYSLSGERMTFDVPFSMLSTPDGVLAHSLEVYRYGTLAERLDSAPAVPGAPAPVHPVPVPDSGAVTTAALTEGAVMALAWPMAALAVFGSLRLAHVVRRRHDFGSRHGPFTGHGRGNPRLS